MFHKIRCDQDASCSQHTVDFPQCFFRFRHHMQGVGDQHNIKGIILIRQRYGIRDLKSQVIRTFSLLRLSDHPIGIIRCDHAFRSRCHVLCQQSRAGCDLQYLFSLDHCRDPVIHELIDLPVRPHGNLINRSIKIPNLLFHPQTLSNSILIIFIFTRLSHKRIISLWKAFTSG